MIMKVLKKIYDIKTPSTRVLSVQLGYDKGIIEHMLIMLKDLNYIEEINLNGCETGACKDCSIFSSCSDKPIIKQWKITKKGLKKLGV